MQTRGVRPSVRPRILSRVKPLFFWSWRMARVRLKRRMDGWFVLSYGKLCGRLLRLQAFCGIGAGGADGLDDGRSRGDEYKDTRGQDEEPGADCGAIGEILQPFFHAEPGKGSSDQDRQHDEAAEV